MAKDTKLKKVKVPESVKLLSKSDKAFAKKRDIILTGKGMSKSDKKLAKKQLADERVEWDSKGINTAVKILVDNDPECEGIDKVIKGTDALIVNSKRMKKVAKEYSNNQDEYPHMRYLPNMILQTIEFYGRDGISPEEQEIANNMDTDMLLSFCEKILKKQIKYYKGKGIDANVAFQLACITPTAKVLNKRFQLKGIIQVMYTIAIEYEVDLALVLKSMYKIDDKCKLSKKEFYTNFYSEFIMQRKSNKNANFTDTQKDLHESLIEDSLTFINSLKKHQCRTVLVEYIKRRKYAEKYKNDGKRVINFLDIANSNSRHPLIKEVVTELIAEDKDNSSYLS